MGRRHRRRRPESRQLRHLLDQARDTRASGGVRSFVAPDEVRRLIAEGKYTVERACHTKARFGLYDHAENARLSIAARHADGQPHQIYPCPFCAGFHLFTVKEFER